MSVKRLQRSVMEASAPIFLGNIAVCVLMDLWLPWIWGPVSVRGKFFKIHDFIFGWRIIYFLPDLCLSSDMLWLCFVFCGTFSVSLTLNHSELRRENSTCVTGLYPSLSAQMWTNVIWTQTSVSTVTVRTPKARSSATVSWDTLSRRDPQAAQVHAHKHTHQQGKKKKHQWLSESSV